MNDNTVYAYIISDLLHIGHVSYLEKARSFGDKLIVGVLTDSATMEKKPKPEFSFGERVRLLKSLRCVDVVVAQKTYSPADNIKTLKPSVVIESDLHDGKIIEEVKEAAKSYGGKLVIIKHYNKQYSTREENDVVKGG